MLPLHAHAPGAQAPDADAILAELGGRQQVQLGPPELPFSLLLQLTAPLTPPGGEPGDRQGLEFGAELLFSLQASAYCCMR